MHALVKDWRSSPISDEDMRLCKFAQKLTHRQHEVSAQDLDDLRAVGFSDRAIHDAVQVIGYFNYITRVADGLGVDAEEFIEPWGE